MPETSEHANSAETSGSPALRGPESADDFVVGVGASADGLDALQRFFAALPEQPDLVFVVAQHLAPDHDSDLGQILQQSTDMAVRRAADGTALEPNHVYVLPPAKKIGIRDGNIELDELPDLHGGRATIDFLFRSLAEQRGDRAVGVLLSGAGSDGTTGLRIIKESGGITMAQQPTEAGMEAMPRNAVNAGVVDFVEPVVGLADRLVELPEQRRQLGPLDSPDELADGERETLDHITALLRERTGTDLSKYKRPTILRRVGRRMQVHQIETLGAYKNYLEDHDDEMDALFEELLIGVTGFFRDLEAWQRLDDEVLTELFDRKSTGDELRVWVPGCSTGEEAYSAAMLLSRRAEEHPNPPEIKIFATDVNSDAVEFARRGSYPSAIVSDVPDDLMHRYLRAENGRFRVAKPVRRRVMFAPQNVLTDPPFSNLDLITCRNLLIYLEPEAQRRLLDLLHYALDDDGFMMLGKSESVTQRAD
ncbi:MAG: chemotaxis protein CheB, partial [Bradymonadaceae bacterium]